MIARPEAGDLSWLLASSISYFVVFRTGFARLIAFLSTGVPE
jgi:hypothetical protein